LGEYKYNGVTFEGRRYGYGELIAMIIEINYSRAVIDCLNKNMNNNKIFYEESMYEDLERTKDDEESKSTSKNNNNTCWADEVDDEEREMECRKRIIKSISIDLLKVACSNVDGNFRLVNVCDNEIVGVTVRIYRDGDYSHNNVCLYDANARCMGDGIIIRGLKLTHRSAFDDVNVVPFQTLIKRWVFVYDRLSGTYRCNGFTIYIKRVNKYCVVGKDSNKFETKEPRFLNDKEFVGVNAKNMILRSIMVNVRNIVKDTNRLDEYRKRIYSEVLCH
jgi:hypothetical protein